MEAQGLFYPQTSARADPYIFDKNVGVEVHSSKASYFDWAKVCFVEKSQPKIALARKDEVVIEFGYNGIFDEIFTGFVAKPCNAGGFVDEVNLEDEMPLLKGTIISNASLDTTPQEVIAYCLTQASILEMKLTGIVYPRRTQLPIRQMNVTEAINTIHAVWGIKKPFFSSFGVFYWGKKPQQSKVYLFGHGVNILSPIYFGGVWELETISAPLMKHSHKVAVEHPRVSSEFEVSSVKITINEDGFIHTYISF